MSIKVYKNYKKPYKNLKKMNEQQNERQRFLQRFSHRFADLNPEDEENYYGRANALMDDYEAYESATKGLIEALDGNSQMMDMISQACAQADFDPVAWMIEHCGADLQALLSDPDYATLLAKAHSKHIEEEAQRREIDNEMRHNLPLSLEAIGKRAEELHVDEETKNAIVARLWQLGEEMVKGVLPVEIFDLMVKGRNYDEELAAAFDRGRSEGLNIRIDEHLRQVRSSPVSIQPTQTPVKPSRPRPRSRNPFVDSDWS